MRSAVGLVELMTLAQHGEGEIEHRGGRGGNSEAFQQPRSSQRVAFERAALDVLDSANEQLASGQIGATRDIGIRASEQALHEHQGLVREPLFAEGLVSFVVGSSLLTSRFLLLCRRRGRCALGPKPLDHRDDQSNRQRREDGGCCAESELVASCKLACPVPRGRRLGANGLVPDHALQVVREVRHGFVAIPDFLRQCLAHDGLDVGRNVRVERQDGTLANGSFHLAQEVRSRIRQSAREELVEDDAQRVLIGGRSCG